MKETSSQTQIFSLDNSDPKERPTVTCRPIYFLNFWLHTLDFKEAHLGKMLNKTPQSLKKKDNCYER